MILSYQNELIRVICFLKILRRRTVFELFFIFCNTGLQFESIKFKNFYAGQKFLRGTIGLFRPWSKYFSTCLKVCFYRAQNVFWPFSRYASTVLEVSFDHARGMLLPWLRYVSTTLEVCFDRARGLLRPCTRYVSTVIEVYFYRARGMFQPRSRYVSTVLEVCFYRARGMFRLCARPKPLSRLLFVGWAMTCARCWITKHRESTSARDGSMEAKKIADKFWF